MADGTVGPGMLRARGLTKTFGDTTAVSGLALDVVPGEVVGLLGPNGAGKTTTLRMLLGLARPTAGSITVLDHPPGDPRAVGRLGAVVEEPSFYPYLTGYDNLRVVVRYTDAPEARIDTALDEVGLRGAADAKVKTYSLGMRQRLALAAALVKDPELLILDEPANGLDPAGISALRSWLRSFATGGRTVLFSSHQLSEVEQICDRVIVLVDGRVVADGGVDELRSGREMVIVAEPLDRAREVAGSLEIVSSLEVDGDRLRVVAEPGAAPDVNAALVGAGVRVAQLSPAQRSLEDVFFELTADSVEATGSGNDPGDAGERSRHAR